MIYIYYYLNLEMYTNTKQNNEKEIFFNVVVEKMLLIKGILF